MASINVVHPAVAPGTVPAAGIGNFCAGKRVQFRCRFGEWVFNATTVPLPNTFVEGPYLLIRPDVSGYHEVHRRGNNPGDVYNGGAPTQATLNATEGDDWEYRVDLLSNPSFTFPWNASVSVEMAVAGSFLIDVIEGPDLLRNDGANLRMRQTRQFRTGVSRTLVVPRGAYAFEVLATAMPTVILSTEGTSKRAFGGTSAVSVTPAGSGIPMSLGGARTLQIAAPAVDTLVVFHVAVP